MAEEEYLTCSWKEFETWIRETISGDFRWKIRPQDNASNREMVADLIKDVIKRNNGTFPDRNSFIERLDP